MLFGILAGFFLSAEENGCPIFRKALDGQAAFIYTYSVIIFRNI
ncbi:hypothetical protein [Lacrimispora sp. 210928-DFI.3.58]|nr:hypothetical protein [Lacrimispora sp. 210928-DFI.3.58]